MDEAKHGVIFVSMGSNIRMKNMDPEKREAFIKVRQNRMLKELSYNVKCISDAPFYIKNK